MTLPNSTYQYFHPHTLMLSSLPVLTEIECECTADRADRCRIMLLECTTGIKRKDDITATAILPPLSSIHN